MISKYFNPYTDFGFKKLFGEEASKDLLVDFLNQLLPVYHQIKELTFKNNENLSDTKEERKSIFDIYCTSQTGERFIVEMQKAKKRGQLMKNVEERAKFDDYDFSDGVRGRFYQPQKIRATLQLDNDVLLFLKKQASEKHIKYQVLVNNLLRDYMSSIPV